MDYDVIPLTMTQVHWEPYIKLCQDILGYSPTRGLDDASIPVQSAQAFLATLDLDNQPLQNLRYCNHTFKHVHSSFLIKADISIALYFASISELDIIVRDGKKATFIILSGTLYAWYLTICESCKADKEYEIRWIMNKVIECFDRGGFKEIFYNHERYPLTDGTFILR